MTLRIGVLDYGMGNLRSVTKALEVVGGVVTTSDLPEILEGSDLLVVPGQGAFHTAMKVLRDNGLDGFVADWVRGGKPYLGICLGLQLLFESSEEAPGVKGLGLFPGRVVKFRPKSAAVKIPHIGWNSVEPRGGLTALLPKPGYFYFVHSFYAAPKDRAVVGAETPYEKVFCSAVARENVVATQFHPEKSGDQGLGFLKNVIAKFS